MKQFTSLLVVEQLGSGIHRILSVYDSDIFRITDNFFEISFTFEEVAGEVAGEVTGEVAGEVKMLLQVLIKPFSRVELQEMLGLKSQENFRNLYLIPALEQGVIEMTVPDKPKSRLQKYRLTEAGKGILKEGT